MARIDQNIELFNTEDKTLTFTVDNGDGSTAVDITGTTITWKAARHPQGSSVLSKSGVITDADAGEFTVTLSDSDLAGLDGVYYHEARMRDGSGNDTVVASGTLVVNKGLA
jgi:hypothetical protein